MYTETIPSSVSTGRRFETYTAEWLRSRGYKILERNYIAGRFEIDIIAMKKNVVCFVEVKAERTTPENEGSDAPPEKIDEKKMRNIVSAAAKFTSSLRRRLIDTDEFVFRFDGAGILFDEAYNVTDFRYYEGLYTPKKNELL